MRTAFEVCECVCVCVCVSSALRLDYLTLAAAVSI